MFHRIFVEKKEGFDIEARKITKEIREQLQLPAIEKIRIVNRYETEVGGTVDFDRILYGIFAEINQDTVAYELPTSSETERVFGVEYQPGQYDIRCDSAEQCVKLLYPSAEIKVHYAKLYLISGTITDSDLVRIQNYIINPVDSRLANLNNEASDQSEQVHTEGAAVLDGFIDCSDEELKRYIKEKSLAMDLADIRMIRDYFQFEEGRNPTETELKVLDTYWSDHCRHTTFSTKLDVSFEDGPLEHAVREDYETYLNLKKELGRENKPVTLMDIATLAARYHRSIGLDADVEVSEEINACSFEIDADVDGETKPYLLMFKNETHNHPTEIEPFGGAATCLGGAIRDPLSGRSYVYQSMRVTGCADPTVPIDCTMKGKLPQRKITTQAASGFSSYGNQIGLCTGQVKEYYHPDFAAKRMEVGAVIAAAPKENVVRKSPVKGDIIYVIGGRTGRDGIGGASGSSKEHNEKSVDTAGSEVQKGNAPEERKLQRLFRNSACAKLIKKCNDFGAGGVSVAIGELADSLDIDLNTLLLKYLGLNATELAISESQERMAVVVDPSDEEEFLSYVKAENIEYSKTAVVTDTGRLVMRLNGEEVLNLSRAFIDTNGAEKEASVHVTLGNLSVRKDDTAGFAARLNQLAAELNIASQKGLVEMFDNTIGASTVLMPYGGQNMLTPSDVMASKLPVDGTDSKTVSLMAHGYDPFLAEQNPYLGGLYAVLSAVTKLVCAGADYQTIKLSLQEYFEKLRDDPERWGKPFAALLGALRAQLNLRISAIGGKDSMSGSYETMDVPPSLIAFGVAVTDIGRVVSDEFKQAGSPVVLIAPKKQADGTPDLSAYRQNLNAVRDLISNRSVLSAKAVTYGGTAASVMQMCFGNGLGFTFDDALSQEALFETDYAAAILELKDETALSDLSVPYTKLGMTTDMPQITYQNEAVVLSELISDWKKPLDNIFPQQAGQAADVTEIVRPSDGKRKAAAAKYAKPRVFVPVFPGTNCEYDTIKAFEKAGAVCDPFVFRNKTPQDVADSVAEMQKRIRAAQIVMFSGGFSAGDEPDGSGKFIVSVLRNPYITEAITELMEERDGLMLGICNGFQALIKTGLLPYGKITDLQEDSPTLTFNTIGRHVAKVVYTKLVSDRSVWFGESEIGDVHAVAISHGEGRFVASPEEFVYLKEQGQIVAQYCTADGTVSGDPSVNPNGSLQNIEAVTSPDGRILGKMGHSERAGSGLYQNLTGNFDQKLFVSGVKYYS